MALVERLQISNRIAHLRRDVRPTPGQRKGVHLPVDSLSVVETTRTRVAPHEAWNSCLTRQLVLSEFLHQLKFVTQTWHELCQASKPSFAPNVLHTEYKGIPRLQQRALVSFSVATKPTMLQKSIQIEVFFSAKVTSADVESVYLPRIE